MRYLWNRLVLGGCILLVLVVPGCRQRRNLPPGSPIILIVIDTLRADRLGFYGYERPTSPGLDRWAESGVVFDRAFSTSPWTLPSIASILTGRYPTSHGSGRDRRQSSNGKWRRVFIGLEESVPSLAEVLAAHGYATAAFVTNSFLRPEFGLDRGFESYDFAHNRLLPERRADAIFDRALAWIEAQRDEAFFLLVHVLDPHLPYDPLDPGRGRFTEGYSGPLEVPLNTRQMRRVRKGYIELGELDRQWVASLYDEQLPFLDREMNRFLFGLEECGLLDRALVLLTADHGEELYDHDRFEHGHTMYQELLRVPLVVWGPELRAGRVRESVSGIDLVPTVLDALSLPSLPGLDGTSLWPLLTRTRGLEERGLLAQNTLYGSQEEALLRWPHKLIWNPQRDIVRLFDLDSDPAEQHDLAAIRPELVQELLSELESLSRGVGGPTAEVELSDETRADLETLGYLDD